MVKLESTLETLKFFPLREIRSGFEELKINTSAPTYAKDKIKLSAFDVKTETVLGTAKDTSILRILISKGLTLVVPPM